MSNVNFLGYLLKMNGVVSTTHANFEFKNNYIIMSSYGIGLTCPDSQHCLLVKNHSASSWVIGASKPKWRTYLVEGKFSTEEEISLAQMLYPTYTKLRKHHELLQELLLFHPEIDSDYGKLLQLCKEAEYKSKIAERT